MLNKNYNTINLFYCNNYKRYALEGYPREKSYFFKIATKVIVTFPIKKSREVWN